MMFQSGALFDSLTVAENIAFPLREAGIRDEEEIDRQVSEALEIVRMPGQKTKMPADLSGGMRKRVALARAVVEKTGARAAYLPIDPAAGIERLNEHLYYFEELYLTSPIPMMEIYRAVAARGVKVTIDGHGADELLS